MKQTITLFFLIAYFFATGQTPIIPYTALSFDTDDFLWSSVTEDSTTADGVNYDGRTHISKYDHYIEPIEHQGYLYTLDMGGLYGIEGGVVTKRAIETGAIVWYSVFDLRTSDYHEYPRALSINEQNELVVISCSSVEAHDPTTTLMFVLNQVPVYWNVRKYDLESGEMLFNKRLDKPELSFPSGELQVNGHLFFVTTNGYVYMKHSPRYGTENYYIKHTINQDLEPVEEDTVYLNLPDFWELTIAAGFIPCEGGGYCSMDVKIGAVDTGEARTYNLYFWDEEFNVVDSMPHSKLQEVFDFEYYPSRYNLEFADDKNIFVRIRKFVDGDWETKVRKFDRNGNFVQDVRITSKGYLVDNSAGSECPIVYGRIRGDSINGFTAYSLCDSSKWNMEAHTVPANLAIFPYDGTVLSNGEVLLSMIQFKDTTINGERKGYVQGIVYSLFEGDQLGLVSVLEPYVSPKASVVVSPNPTKSIISVDCDMPFDFIFVYTNTGQLVGKYGNQKQIDLSKFTGGLYHLVLKNNGQIVGRAKCVRLRN